MIIKRQIWVLFSKRNLWQTKQNPLRWETAVADLVGRPKSAPLIQFFPISRVSWNVWHNIGFAPPRALILNFCKMSRSFIYLRPPDNYKNSYPFCTKQVEAVLHSCCWHTILGLQVEFSASCLFVATSLFRLHGSDGEERLRFLSFQMAQPDCNGLYVEDCCSFQ